MVHFKYGTIVGAEPIEDFLDRGNPPPYVSIDMTHPWHSSAALGGDRGADLRRRLEQAQTKCVLHHPFQVNLADPVEPTRTAAVRFCEQMIGTADELGAEFIILHGGYVAGVTAEGPGVLLGRALDNLVDSLKRLTASADAAGVRLALENFPSRHPDSKDDILWMLTTTDELEDVYARVGAPDLGFLFEVGHAHIGNATADYLERFGDRLVGAHISDNDGHEDQHLPPGGGSVPWQGLVDSLESRSFSGPLFLDYPDGVEDVHGAARRFASYWPGAARVGRS